MGLHFFILKHVLPQVSPSRLLLIHYLQIRVGSKYYGSLAAMEP